MRLIGLTVRTEPRNRSDALEAFVKGVSGTKSRPLLVPINKNLSSSIAPQRGCELREAGKVGVRGVSFRFMDANVEAVAYEECIPAVAAWSTKYQGLERCVSKKKSDNFGYRKNW